ncbi:c-type cytochrome biogenesis protein CcmI [Allorhizobium sp. BGMRC 0089]|uniref:c-type cytochrome biogenesis protein CcmI n=1 Tax=Allorhizobium sonneratiae TaxID=2934936 RepID=UPI002033C5B8|nr:c-type cytochrome biogenesis protein CcmI [Allorhizobium sonneratiae]MCM2291915.1 c-type cytochrome biogenesis protein CcmI [Allorhizobium sonneratiae]
MLFWIVIAVLTFGVAAAFLRPLAGGMARAEIDARAGALAVYRDQLQELDRDRQSGLIGVEDAEYARAEIARRLLAASNAAVKAARPGKNRLAQILVILLVPATGLGFYLMLGSPGLPDQPLQARLDHPGNDMSILIAKVERHLIDHPDDGKGWDLLAPIYMREQRPDQAETAFRNAIRINGASVARLNGLAEALMAEHDGVITDEALDLLRQSKAMSADNPQTDYYLALALEQSGKKAEALAAFEALAKASPPDAPWQAILARHIEKNGGTAAVSPAPPGNPSAADMAAAEKLSPQARQEMIAGMVTSLDAKLKADPNNFPGWMRLVRSYVMLKDQARAMAALKAGLKAFPAEGEQGKELLAAARSLGLPVEELAK